MLDIVPAWKVHCRIPKWLLLVVSVILSIRVIARIIVLNFMCVIQLILSKSLYSANTNLGKIANWLTSYLAYTKSSLMPSTEKKIISAQTAHGCNDYDIINTWVYPTLTLLLNTSQVSSNSLVNGALLLYKIQTVAMQRPWCNQAEPENDANKSWRVPRKGPRTITLQLDSLVH